MLWFSASLMFKSNHSIPNNDEPLWEEMIILVQANSEQGAEEEARRIGATQEVQYAAESEDVVSWKFEAVQSVYYIDDFKVKNGAEVFSRFLKESEVRSILQKFE